MHFAPFFFLEFRPESAVSAVSADTARVKAASARVGLKKTNAMWHDAAGRDGTREQRRPLRVAASDTGTAPLVPRLCFTTVRLHCEN